MLLETGGYMGKSRFKAGDRVKVISLRHYFKKHYIEKFGTILHNEIDHENRWVIRFDNSDLNCSAYDEYKGGCSSWVFFDEELEHARVKNNRLAKKLYPNAEESEDGRWLYV